MNNWHAYRLLRVIAPAGFGKSTLGTQWFQSLAESLPPERPIRAWVALDSTDDAPERFLRRLVDALSTDFPDAPDLLTRSLATEQPFPRILDDLLTLLAHHPGPIVLLFDDLHRLHDAVTLALLQHILDEAPPTLHLALFSRTRPPLQVSRLQLDQLVLSLNAHDLHFDHEEFTDLVSGSPLAALDDDQLRRIEHHAGGWAAGLQIMLQAARDGSSASFRDAIVADDFWDYIESEVLQHLPPPEIDFLIDISVLPWLTANLCSAVTGQPPAECAMLLQRIAAANLLITAPTGADRAHAGSMHAVLREFLLRRLQKRHSTDVLLSIRHRAAQCLADAGEIDAALDLLLPVPHPDGEHSLHWLGDDIPTAASLVERVGHTALQQGELVDVRRWMRKLPDSAIRASPRLAIDSAWATVHLLEPGSDRLMQRIYDAMRTAPGTADDAMRAEVVIMETLRHMIDGRYEKSWNAITRARTMPIPKNSMAAGYFFLCSGYLMFGDRRSLDERVHDLQRAYDIFSHIGALRGKLEALCLETSLRRLYADAGLITSAARAKQFMRETGIDSNIRFDFGDALYAMNAIDAARAELSRAVIPDHEDSGESIYPCVVRLHLCDLADGINPAIDEENDEKAWNVLRSNGAGIIVFNTGHRRVIRDMRRGRPDLCWNTITSLGVLPPDLTPSTPLAHTLAVLSAAAFTGRDLDVVGTQLIDFRNAMNAINHRFFKLHAHAVLVHLLVEQGKRQAALAELRTLLADLEVGSYIRIVLDLPKLYPLLREIATPFAEHLADLTKSNAPLVTISPAERRVLAQFTTGKSIVEIAAYLFLSPETVRTHTKSIYTKLGVRNRILAVERARQMGIL